MYKLLKTNLAVRKVLSSFDNRKYLLGAVAKLPKSDCQLRHVCPPVRTKQLGSHRTDFREILYLNIFSKSVGENPVLIKVWQEQRVLYVETSLQVSKSTKKIFVLNSEIVNI
jgi:hypothetical protein